MRWEPGTPQRLQEAALELFATRGFEQTTATEIAQAVGLTERTFYRHFADKREVLFYGQELLLDAFLTGVAGALPEASPLEVVTGAVAAASTLFTDDRRAHSRTRQSVIEAHPALQEREQHKLATIATRIADALRARGIAEPAATLAAQTGATVFGIAFAQWIRPDERRGMADIAAAVFGELRTLVAVS